MMVILRSEALTRVLPGVTPERRPCSRRIQGLRGAQRHGRRGPGDEQCVRRNGWEETMSRWFGTMLLAVIMALAASGPGAAQADDLGALKQ
jgi:hypothetical protein